jgi:hypothetical protein
MALGLAGNVNRTPAEILRAKRTRLEWRYEIGEVHRAVR